MGSSYDKIAKHLLHCADTKAAFLLLEEGLRAPRVTGFDFRLIKEPGKPVYAEPTFTIDFGLGVLKRRPMNREDLLSIDKFDTWGLSQIFPIDKIIKDNFGTKQCPTYNCAMDRVSGGGENGTGFTETIREEIGRRFGNRRDQNGDVIPGLLSIASDAARAQIAEILDSKEYRDARFAFMRDHAVKDIVAVMQHYDCLGKEVLREALDTFVMHQIMEPDEEG